MSNAYPPAPKNVRPEVETAPIELDDDLTRRDAWMFLPLAAIVIALPILVTAMFGFSAWDLANRDEASAHRRRRSRCAGRSSRCRCCVSWASGRHLAERAVECRARRPRSLRRAA